MMLRKINKIENVRRFRSYDSSHRDDSLFEKLTVIYGSNGTGKTTLAAILRSLTSGDSDIIRKDQWINQDMSFAPINHDMLGRNAVSATSTSPFIEITSDDGNISYTFKNGKWSTTLPNIHIFDIHFCSLLFRGVQPQYSELDKLFISDGCEDVRNQTLAAMNKCNNYMQGHPDSGVVTSEAFRRRELRDSEREFHQQSTADSLPEETSQANTRNPWSEFEVNATILAIDCVKAERDAEDKILEKHNITINKYLKRFNANFGLKLFVKRSNTEWAEFHEEYHRYAFKKCPPERNNILYAIVGDNPSESSHLIDVTYLSEGDRSAIALSCFLAKLDYDIEQSNSIKPILVFDDPVTSLDSNRRKQTIEIIKNLLFSDRISQSIVLSHDAHILNDLLICINKKQEHNAVKSVKTAEFEIVTKDGGKSSSLVDKDIMHLAGSRYNACLKTIHGYLNMGTNDLGIKANVMVCIRQVLEANLRDRFSDLIENAIPIIHQRMCGKMISELEKEKQVKSTDPMLKKESIIEELREINETVSAAAHVTGINQDDNDHMDTVMKTSIAELNALIQQTLNMIDNKLPLLVYTLPKGKQRNVTTSSNLTHTTAP